jgi:hypothetical protein
MKIRCVYSDEKRFISTIRIRQHNSSSGRQLFGVSKISFQIWVVYMKKILFAALLFGFPMQLFAADSIKLAITGPFCGGFAPMGTSMRDGAKLAINEINADGGITVGGKKLKFEVIERDDEAKNDRGALIAQELASTDDLSGVKDLSIFRFATHDGFQAAMVVEEAIKIASLPRLRCCTMRSTTGGPDAMTCWRKSRPKATNLRWSQPRSSTSVTRA